MVNWQGYGFRGGSKSFLNDESWPELTSISQEQAKTILERFDELCDASNTVVPIETREKDQRQFPPFADLLNPLKARADGTNPPRDVEQLSRDAFYEYHYHLGKVASKHTIDHYSNYEGDNSDLIALKNAALALKQAILETIKPEIDLERTGMAKTK